MGDVQTLGRLTTLNEPENLDAESALLGAILTNGRRAMPMVEEYLRPEHFYEPLNGVIYTAALRMHAAGVEPNVILIRNQIGASEVLMGRDVAEYLGQIMMATVGILNAGDYGRAIFDAWTRRQLRNVCIDVSRLCLTPGGQSGEQIVEQMEAGLLDIAQNMRESLPNVTISEAIREAIACGRENVARGSALAGLSWGYPAMDRMTGGLLDEALYVIGARPAMGKTAWALGVAMRVAANGQRVLFWSGEMAARQIGARAGAAYAGLSTLSVFAGRRYDIPEDVATGLRAELEEWQWQALHEGERAAEEVALELDVRSGLTVAGLRSRARRMKRSKRGLGLIVLDYVGLMHGSDAARRRGRYEEMSEISAGLKSLAKELGIPIIALAQLNREVEKREDKRPTEADLRDSGGLEQDADLVAFLYRDHYYLKKEASGDGLQKRDKETNEQFANRCSEFQFRLRESVGKAQVLIRKNRHGGTGSVRMRFDDDSTWFRDECEDPRSPAWVCQGGAS
ncbi:replicative DNA helicase [Asaia spathodeae]|uniref:DNA 5'-3' helicase n=1 Tax=Asaia spathodeae TaxID=657016 RepID=A0ABX2P8I7_9PROT|nr:DnaB-like helicase C-terminal domain-containing protein [Asaia spathodeae]GBR21027.1 prophage replicative DNA helicase DnaB [Asaia spathodeae NBRC 105894]